jgi:hypothetical protein
LAKQLPNWVRIPLWEPKRNRQESGETLFLVPMGNVKSARKIISGITKEN